MRMLYCINYNELLDVCLITGKPVLQTGFHGVSYADVMLSIKLLPYDLLVPGFSSKRRGSSADNVLSN
jgi:hypothetical protein